MKLSRPKIKYIKVSVQELLNGKFIKGSGFYINIYESNTNEVFNIIKKALKDYSKDGR